jgi:DNA-binding MarR family transcriptional regulator
MKESKAIDQIVHQPVRTRLLAHLVSIHSCSYTSLRDKVNISDGNMTTHIKVLLSNDYITMEKEFVDNKPKTTYMITKKGRQAFNNYIRALKSIIEN